MEARSWTQPLAPALPVPDAFLHRRLRLTDAWLAGSGEWRTIEDEPSAGLWSILGYLRWHGPGIMAQDPNGDDFGDPDGYLASRPLVAAIDAELARRAEVGHGEALALLRAIGLAPWELPADHPRAAEPFIESDGARRPVAPAPRPAGGSGPSGRRAG
jgi:hypothetical protein